MLTLGIKRFYFSAKTNGNPPVLKNYPDNKYNLCNSGIYKSNPWMEKELQ